MSSGGALLPLVYEELRRLAAGYLDHERSGQTLPADGPRSRGLSAAGSGRATPARGTGAVISLPRGRGDGGGSWSQCPPANAPLKQGATWSARSSTRRSWPPRTHVKIWKPSTKPQPARGRKTPSGTAGRAALFRRPDQRGRGGGPGISTATAETLLGLRPRLAEAQDRAA